MDSSSELNSDYCSRPTGAATHKNLDQLSETVNKQSDEGIDIMSGELMDAEESFQEEDSVDEILYESEDDDGEEYESLVGSEGEADANDIEDDKPSLPAKESTKYEVLATDDILKYMSDTVVAANSLIQLPSQTTVRILLNHFGWDKDKLWESYFSGGDEEREQIFRKVGLENPLMTKGFHNVFGSEDEECENCLDLIASTKLCGMKCGHRFCVDCWTQYLTSRIGEEGTGHLIFCLAYNCNFLLEDSTVMNFVKDSYSVQLKYQRQIINSFVQSHRHIKWCPSPDCIYAIKTEKSRVDDDDKPVTCKCGHAFCFQCTAPAHIPISCGMFKNWNMLEAKDLLSTHWIAENTKDCPKCKTPIEKNGGCNFMLCPSCHSEFCWICMSLTNSHQHFAESLCNSFDETTAVKSTNQSPDMVQAARYNFYFHRYNSHRWSHRMESKLYEVANVSFSGSQVNIASDYDFQKMVIEAIDTLQRCRQTLMYTCVFANFVLPSTENSQIEIFEKNLEDLRAAVENLSDTLEKKLWDDWDGEKKKLTGMFSYCESRRKVLIDHVREGEEKDFWKFQDW